MKARVDSTDTRDMNANTNVYTNANVYTNSFVEIKI